MRAMVIQLHFRCVRCSIMHACTDILRIGKVVDVRLMPGFGPAAEPLLFRQKEPKPVTPRLASIRGDGP